MPTPNEFDLARQRVLEAEKELNEYCRQHFVNLDQMKRLTAAVRSARAEFVDSVASLFPDVLKRTS